VGLDHAMQQSGWILRPLPFALLATVALAWFRRFFDNALVSVESKDAAAIWYGTLRALKIVSTTLWLLWLGGVLALDPWQATANAFHLGLVGHAALHNGLTLLGPSLILAAIDVMSYPVVRRVRQLDITQREYTCDSIFGRIWLTLPVSCFSTGFQLLQLGRDRLLIAGMGFCVLGLLSFFLLQFGWLRRKLKAQFTPHAVTFGALRDRVFALAEIAGVKLTQIYVFPMSRWRLANAYASEEKTLLLTDWLLRHLSRREVDAVIGHELAHMKKGHVAVQGWLFALLFIAPLIWFRSRNEFPNMATVAFLFVVCWHLISFLSNLVSRKHERQADLEGVQISKDPEAFITALTQLDRLNMMPGDLETLDESVVTHPSTRKRIAAIARLSNFSWEQVNNLVATVRTRGFVQGYELPPVVEAATTGTSPLFSSALKRQISLRFTFAYMFVLGGIPPSVCI